MQGRALQMQGRTLNAGPYAQCMGRTLMQGRLLNDAGPYAHAGPFAQ